ncbi:MAG: nitrous oxide reductase family maturation protein NosD [Rhodospirillales bacterium]|nr:nitrous oxide reductase family maturation protein NosD [Rhodospirillales bacterium]
MIDAAKTGDTVSPPPGVYKAPIRITKAITLDGGGRVTIDGAGKGTVLWIETNGATVRGLRLIGSGESHNDIDSGIQVRGNYNVIKDNVIEDALFGINMQQSDNNIVRRNRIKSKTFSLGVRGDSIRLWYSKANRIEDNDIRDARDLVVWYSGDNVIARNHISGGRYGLHFMYALSNIVEGNRFRDNSVGMFLMYSDGLILRNNTISHALGATGMGIGLKESSDVTIEGNDIVYSATGLYLDVSPFQPDTTNRIRNNLFAFNSIGVLFHNDWQGNIFQDNRFEDNYVQVSVNAKASARRNAWDGNFWDDYAGFDLDRNGIGDTAHEMRVYADRLWMDVPPTAFFKGSAVLSLLDFLERLAPFTEPIVLLRDGTPKIRDDVHIARAGDGKKESPDTAEDERLKYDPFGLKKRVKKYMKAE